MGNWEHLEFLHKHTELVVGSEDALQFASITKEHNHLLLGHVQSWMRPYVDNLLSRLFTNAPEVVKGIR
jgi:hypothetical protein